MKHLLFILPFLAMSVHAAPSDGQKIAVVKKVMNNIEARDVTVAKNATSSFSKAIVQGCMPWEYLGGHDLYPTKIRKSAKYQVQGDKVKVSYNQYGGKETVYFYLKKGKNGYLIDDIHAHGVSLKAVSNSGSECLM